MTTLAHADRITAALDGKRSRGRCIRRCPAHAFADEIEAVERSPPGIYAGCRDEFSICSATVCLMSNKLISMFYKLEDI